MLWIYNPDTSLELKREYPVQQNDFPVLQEIVRTVLNADRIAVFGDYDVDGISSAVIMKKTLDKIGIKNYVRLPERKEGYGIKPFHIHELKAKEFNTIITVDNGITAFEAVEEAKKLGMKIIITDHHEPKKMLPPADIIFDPKLYNSYQDYSGAGVAFLVARELLKAKNIPITDDLLQLASLATVADVVPLDGNNWYIARKGLEYIRERPITGIQKIIDTTSINRKRIGGFELSWIIIPRLNAPGRMDSPVLAYNLLLNGEGVETINQINRERLEAVEQFMDRVSDKKDLFLTYIFPDCPKGIIGLIAGRAAEKYGKPALVGTIGENNTVVASCRAPGKFDLMDAFNFAAKYVDISYGGHKSACGVHFNLEDYGKLQKVLNMYTLKNPVEFEPVMLDGILTHKPTVQEIEYFDDYEPFGYKNPEPAFLVEGKVVEVMRTEKWQLIRLDNEISFFGEKDYAVGQQVKVVLRPTVKGGYVNFKVLDEEPQIQYDIVDKIISSQKSKTIFSL
ncbi:single-stranded-DNA-specific exonuclease RecJ [Thermoanaerobacter mathranii]|uniref:single-stranded-DNA-specific exonuclease RecJ n=1 Tax=Thermoanaerobacter mathranii TaxID=583357 RepID=UPI003D6AC6C5